MGVTCFQIALWRGNLHACPRGGGTMTAWRSGGSIMIVSSLRSHLKADAAVLLDSSSDDDASSSSTSFDEKDSSDGSGGISDFFQALFLLLVVGGPTKVLGGLGLVLVCVGGFGVILFSYKHKNEQIWLFSGIKQLRQQLRQVRQTQNGSFSRIFMDGFYYLMDAFISLYYSWCLGWLSFAYTVRQVFCR